MATVVAMTGLQFDALPYDEGRLWELLDGDLIEVPSPTLQHQDIVFSPAVRAQGIRWESRGGARSSGY